jgi:hypothetical protein
MAQSAAQIWKAGEIARQRSPKLQIICPKKKQSPILPVPLKAHWPVSI